MCVACRSSRPRWFSYGSLRGPSQPEIFFTPLSSQGVWALLACGTRDAVFLSAPPGFPGPLQSHSCEAGSVLKEKSEWPLEGTQLVLNKWDSTGL